MSVTLDFQCCLLPAMRQWLLDNQLISCSSVEGGICALHDLSIAVL